MGANGSYNPRSVGMGAGLRERQRIASANDHGPETPDQRRTRLRKLREQRQPKRTESPAFYNEEGKANG